MLAATGPGRNSCYSHTRLKQLPVEIIFEIIAIVAPEDNADLLEDNRFPSGSERDAFSTLAAASLVSRAWNTVCRRYTFDRVSISSKNPSARLSFLHFDAPHLGKYIRKLHLWWDKDTSIASEWFPDCFARFNNLTELYVVFQETLNLSTAPAPLAAGLVSLLAAPRLRKLLLCDWSFAGDASDLLSLLPPGLKELSLENIVTTDTEAKAPSTIRLGALQVLGLTNIHHPMLTFKDLIECPSLDSFTGGWPRDQLWEIPPWVSPSLSELALEAEFGGNIPELPTSIRPSVVTIELKGDNAYLDLFTWIIDCVDHFPFPDLIQDLTITIVNSHRLAEHPNAEQLYPRISEYVVLARFLEYLCEDGDLASVDLDITMMVDSLDVDLHASAARELAKLKMGFEGLLKANVLHASFEVERWVDCEPETVLYCDI